MAEFKVGDAVTVLAPEGRRLDGVVAELRGRLIVVRLASGRTVEVNILRLVAQ